MTVETDRPDSKSPIDLALEADFGLGALRVGPSTREVLSGAEREMLEPWGTQVLVALLAAFTVLVTAMVYAAWNTR